MTHPPTPTEVEQEIDRGERFGFGENWSAFLRVVDESRVAASVSSMAALLPPDRIAGRSFLDIGCGSGLSSLAARRLGAARIHSLDVDPRSVACTTEMKRRFAPDATEWTVGRGDVLDPRFTSSLGAWDIVYSWGVLHHTGRMWDAIDGAARLVRPGGALFIAIYNDQGLPSRVWLRVKEMFNGSRLGRLAVLGTYIPYFILRGLGKDLLTGAAPLARYRTYREQRGMSVYHDWVDWLGGLPFEVAKPEEIFSFLADRGFTLERLQTCAGGLGCNQFVFRAAQDPRP